MKLVLWRGSVYLEIDSLMSHLAIKEVWDAMTEQDKQLAINEVKTRLGL